MSIVYHHELVQGEQAWHDARCGLLTASEMHFLVTPTLKIADNDKTRGHLYELLAQRITRHVEPQYISDSMLRGINDELEAVDEYKKHYAPVKPVGFITNDKWGFTIGYSPDGIIGEDGLLECKSRNQKLQIATLTKYVAADTIDPDFMIQVQTGLLVTERKWCDLISYCGGLPMATIRVFPDDATQEAIRLAATAFESRMKLVHDTYTNLLASKARLIPTIRKIELEMI